MDSLRISYFSFMEFFGSSVFIIKLNVHIGCSSFCFLAHLKNFSSQDMANQARRWHPGSSSGVVNLDDNHGSCRKLQGDSNAPFMVKALLPAEENRRSLEEPENPVFESEPVEDSVNYAALRFSHELKLEPSVQGWVKVLCLISLVFATIFS